jgi:hypothetical protein
MSSDVPSVRLTAGQSLRLVLGCVPLVSLLVLVGLHLAVALTVLGQGLPPIGYFVVVAVAAVFTGWDASNCLRDLLAGVALVADDRLERVTNSRRPGRWGYSARFSRLGRMRISYDTYSRLYLGVEYRLVYSPASRHLWAAESLAGARRESAGTSPRRQPDRAQPA